MDSKAGYAWYGNYIAERATTSNPIMERPVSKFLIFDSVVSGKVLVIDSATAPIFLSALNLIISLTPSFLAIMLSRTIAVVWSHFEDRQQRDDRKPRVFGIDEPGLHLPVMFATAGLWISDAWTALCLSW